MILDKILAIAGSISLDREIRSDHELQQRMKTVEESADETRKYIERILRQPTERGVKKSDEIPFKIKQLKKQTFTQRILQQQPKQNAIIELNNLLRKSQSIRNISIQDIQAVAKKYKVNFHLEHRKDVDRFYYDYLEYCLRDKILSDDEIAELWHLKYILGLSDAIVDKIHNEVAKSVYKESVDEAIAKGRLYPNERAFLEKLQHDLRLPDEFAQKVYKTSAEKYLNRLWEGAIADERLSYLEEVELDAMAKTFGIEIKHDEKTKRELDRYRLYWTIDNAPLREVQPGINLQHGEKCYYAGEASWHEFRRHLRRIGYSGLKLRVNIAKGLSWRMADFKVDPVTENVLTQIDSGSVFLTNKRLIFMGTHRTNSLKLPQILYFEPFQNGIEIQKASGRNPFLKLKRNVDIFALILARVIRDLSQG